VTTTAQLFAPPGFYLDRSSDVWELWDSGTWQCKGIEFSGEEASAYAPFTKLEPVAETARAINNRIDRMRADGEVWTLGQVQRIIDREFIG